ncbi:hypothetical protein CEXT_501071 [Caerostris extrusa]|uniref:LAGLIDADG homing endonuclease n=1 Tax=Caerostris extrusa TaxID=172846 RepID=A0AAV4Y9T3_CAEEX|nr:hypothetical protein CEXT_364881 [Caerostris extrusa]GIZ03215.1 hypothetical protein CEXT_501071 [Caerostris extrusa]
MSELNLFTLSASFGNPLLQGSCLVTQSKLFSSDPSIHLCNKPKLIVKQFALPNLSDEEILGVFLYFCSKLGFAMPQKHAGSQKFTKNIMTNKESHYYVHPAQHDIHLAGHLSKRIANGITWYDLRLKAVFRLSSSRNTTWLYVVCRRLCYGVSFLTAMRDDGIRFHFQSGYLKCEYRICCFCANRPKTMISSRNALTLQHVLPYAY